MRFDGSFLERPPAGEVCRKRRAFPLKGLGGEGLEPVPEGGEFGRVEGAGEPAAEVGDGGGGGETQKAGDVHDVGAGAEGSGEGARHWNLNIVWDGEVMGFEVRGDGAGRWGR